MQITDPTVISYQEMTLGTLMGSIDEMNGDFIVAYSLNPDGSCSNNIIVLETDVYSEVDDEFLEFKGKNYNWEVELHSLKSITRHLGSASHETIVDEAKYFLTNRAYRPPSN